MFFHFASIADNKYLLTDRAFPQVLGIQTSSNEQRSHFLEYSALGVIPDLISLCTFLAMSSVSCRKAVSKITSSLRRVCP
jgi:hypothetical protein